jgi:hypothetical protein
VSQAGDYPLTYGLLGDTYPNDSKGILVHFVLWPLSSEMDTEKSAGLSDSLTLMPLLTRKLNTLEEELFLLAHC